MLKLNNLWSSLGKKAKRIGRGNGSWKGTFAGRGMNGQNCRSGGWVAAWFEGWQTPLFRRMPKLKGFSNAIFKKEYNIVNLSDLAILAEKGITTINKEVLSQNGLANNKSAGVKILGNWELNTKMDLVVDKITVSAKTAVEKAGGKVELV